MLDQAQRILKDVFGYDAFRGNQGAIIERVGSGGDALVLMPTGGGKSLCYQIPALLRDGCGIVISPLIALMQDQVDALTELGVRFHIETQDTYSIVTRVLEEGKTMCSLRSRLRRGILYRVASELGATKIALGHHRDDMVATFFMNLFHHSKISGMPPKLRSDDGKHVVIRPLAYVREADIIDYDTTRQFPIIPCNLCGSQENLQRKQVGLMMKQWEKDSPGRIEQISRALGDIRPSQLADPKLFDFMALGRRDDAQLPDAHAWLAGGDRQDDQEAIPPQGEGLG